MEHIIADDLLNENDSNLVFDKTVSLYQWYNQNDVFHKMEFQGINLFSILDDTEFHTFMIIKLREIITLQKILENKSPKRIIAPKQIIDIAQKLVSKDIDFVKIPSSIEGGMTFDKIEVKFDIWKIPVSIKFSRNCLSTSSFPSNTLPLKTL